MKSANMIDLNNIAQRPLLIAGPCSAETEEQVLETARRLKNTGKIDIFRAGIWKPRTRPGSFEGVGETGLSWLVKVKQMYDLPVAVEVARAEHVALCLEHGIDMVWIGARTTVNPFAVQEIADACAGTNLPVMLKNPINPDLSLWLGGMERLIKSGIKQVAAIHRGFSFAGEKIYRNRPQWQIAIDFKTEMPDVTMINDPSHICGRRDILQEVSQTSIDLDYNGLMIESHIDPDNAWSDAKQQVTPERLNEIINALIWRKENTSQQEFITALMHLREQINQVDDELLLLIGQRMKLADKIGEYKRDNNITILQTSRWNEILDRAFVKGENLGLSREFIIRYFNAVHMESINHQNNVMNSEK